MERARGYKSELVPWLCPVCGETKMLPRVGSAKRKACPICREKLRKERYASWYEKNKAEKKPQARQIIEKVSQPAPPKEKTADALLNERIRRQITVQCVKCDWYRCGDSGVNPCCTFYLRHGAGHRVDPGNGPGDCRMFAPKGKRSKKARIEEKKNLLAKIEADFLGERKGGQER